MNQFEKYWEFPLFTLSSGPQITVGQVVVTVLVIFLGILISRWILMPERPVRIGDLVEIDSNRGIVIAFPQRDIHLYAETPIEILNKQT